ncbi:kidins220 [Symbiodinium natans]|uniref:Kidins220 protein n=1 Tax=Symbiodinium natans TaxID=878477 RepID=A0A812TR28_9DINO|nr:kidins220 [Symbiodinium natans]
MADAERAAVQEEQRQVCSNAKAAAVGFRRARSLNMDAWKRDLFIALLGHYLDQPNGEVWCMLVGLCISVLLVMEAFLGLYVSLFSSPWVSGNKGESLQIGAACLLSMMLLTWGSSLCHAGVQLVFDAAREDSFSVYRALFRMESINSRSGLPASNLQLQPEQRKWRHLADGAVQCLLLYGPLDLLPLLVSLCTGVAMDWLVWISWVSFVEVCLFWSLVCINDYVGKVRGLCRLFHAEEGLLPPVSRASTIRSPVSLEVEDARPPQTNLCIAGCTWLHNQSTWVALLGLLVLAVVTVAVRNTITEDEEPEPPDPAALQHAARNGGDVFSSLCKAVATCLERHSQPMLLRKVAAHPAVQCQWTALQRARAVGPATQMWQVLLERPQIFQVSPEPEPRIWLQPGVSLPALQDDRPATTHFTAVAAAAAAISAAGRAAASEGVPLPARKALSHAASAALRPDLLAAVQAQLRKAGGKERLLVLQSKYRLTQAQCQQHFDLLPTGDGDAWVVLRDRPPEQGFAAPDAVGTLAWQQVAAVLPANTSRAAIGLAMATCLDLAAAHGALLARRLLAALAEPNLGFGQGLGRFYLISDVLRNATVAAAPEGSLPLIHSLQEQLPDGCEAFGRCWLRRIEALPWSRRPSPSGMMPSAE